MSASDDRQSDYVSDYRAMSERLPGQRLPWLHQLRAEGLEEFLAQGFPTGREEDWRHTNLAPLTRRRFRPAEPYEGIHEQALAPYLFDTLGAYRLVFINGHFSPKLSWLQTVPDGARIHSLSAALEHNGGAVEDYLGRYARSATHPFVALNSAFMSDGAFIHLKRGVALDRPVHLLYVASGAEDTVAHLRNLIVAEEGAEATIIESYVDLEQAPYFNNAVNEIVVGRNARIEHYRLGRENEASFRISATQVQQQRDSRYTAHNVDLGGRLIRNDLNAVLDAEGAQCVLNGLYVADGRQHIDNHTRIDHRKPHGTSREHYKGVLGGHAHGVFSGKVMVHADAQQTDAQQSNNNLLLSDDAEADSMPQLEIYADDVKCAHGSTVGHLDEDAFFYLRARGLDEPVARSLLVYAFAAEIIERMALAPVRTEMEHQITGKLLRRAGTSLLGLHGRSLEELA